MTATRLPGIYFRTEVPPVPEALPRMDIAAFVGFAAKGPIDVPVPVEDVARFEEIFGASLPLAWDRLTGTIVEAQLAPTVRAFFRDGGRRCWIVRVAGGQAGAPPPSSDHFLIPGLLQATTAGALSAVCAAARSEGSWADTLSVNATTTQRPVPFVVGSPPGRVTVSDVVPAELVRFESPDPSNRRARAIGFVAIPPAPPSAGAVAQRRGARALDPLTGAWFRTALPDDVTPPLSLPSVDSEAVQWIGTAAVAVRLAARSDAPVPVDEPLTLSRWGTHGDVFVLELELPAGVPVGEALPSGAFVRLDLAVAGPVVPSRTLLLQIDSIADLPAAAVSSIPNGERVLATARRGWWSVEPADAIGSMQSAGATAAVVELELWVRDGVGRSTRLANLGLVDGHPRAVQSLRYDWELFSPPGASPSDPFLASIIHPRFPLAIPTTGRAGEPTQTHAYLPLGIAGAIRDELAQSAIVPPGSESERNGVTSFGAPALVDPVFAARSAASLGDQVFSSRLAVEHLAADDLRKLLVLPKLHALYPIDEVSLLAVPDAGAWGWSEPADPPSEPLAAPTLAPIDPPAADGCVMPRWSTVAHADGYELQAADEPLFAGARTVYAGTATVSDCLTPAGDCPIARYYRVRAVGGGLYGPWSQARTIVVPERAFSLCADPAIEPPWLSSAQLSETQVRLAWTIPQPGVVDFVIEESADPAFGAARVVHTGAGDPAGAQRAIALWRNPGAASYYRARATRAGVTSSWSNTAVVAADVARPVLEALETEPDSAPGAMLEEQVLAVHAAMLRFCAGRSDCFAVLSLPGHYRENATLAYRGRLAARLAGDDPDRTLSFGGLFHPWPVVREERSDGPAVTRRTPPDGPVCGTMAARTGSAGPWIAAANMPLRGVVSLTPVLSPAAAQRFFDAQLNQLRATARGIRVLSQETLSPSRELRDINVRRLLILLRRLVLRDGADDVFLPNDASFRRLVQRRFEGIFSRLFARGAFAGAVPDQGFRIVTDESVNDARSVERGLFVVEIRVAPSRPLAFLVVRLIRTSDGVALTEGR